MNIIITGASAGIGYRTAIELCLQHHCVIATARRKDKLEELKKECLKLNPSAKIILLDVDLSEIKQDWINEKLSGEGISVIDGLINNAGFLVNKPFEQLTKSDWIKIYSTNVFSIAELIKLVLPFLEKSASAHILNITSIGGTQGSSKFAGLSAYSSSKGAVTILTECLAEEFKEKNISVNALALGAVQTEMLEKAFPGYKAPMTDVEMAKFVAWFVVNGNRFFNGKILPVALSNP